MTLTTKPRGTNDIAPGEIEFWHELEERIRRVCSAYGFQELRTPIFEHTELFQRGIGEATDIVEKEMYTFLDRGQRSLTLRPEGTAPAVRAFLENNLGAGSLPVKLYYYGPMFRYERPQAGRYRQFVQFGFEVFGSADPLLDVEAIMLPLELYKACGLSGFEVEINSIGCPECRPNYRQELIEYFEPRIDGMCSSCKSRLHRNPMRLLDCKVEACQEVLAGAPPIAKHLCADCSQHFSEVLSYLDALGVEYKLNPRLVRGFDYYTKTVFEVTSKELGSQNAIGAGGRYDGLVEELGGKPTPAVGFAVGVDRLLLALKVQGKLKSEETGPQAYLVHFGGETKRRAAWVAHYLRSHGFWVELDYLNRSIKAQMKAANRLNSRLVLIFGEEELDRGRVIVRNMQDGHEQEADLQELEQLAKMVGECAK
ncbi:MAG TPA: histidine--tRNA ligase [Firmicutes bacterium]|jgi:histidyl-tRNA synthetase|nr:histidine--tRNA ligase [Bacillota bacterium]HHT42362.1 histidine--tRNA ligase [Bacillota bacterium]